MPSIDIVIPCYNYAHLLAQCVQSVLIQEVEDLRIIIIDNASTDNSVEVARRLVESDGRIEVVCHQENLGPHASFNEGIDLARADYFAILCADNLLTPGGIAHGLALLERFPEVSCVIGKFMAPCVANEAPPSLEHDGGWRLMSGDRFIEMCCSNIKVNLPDVILVRTSLQKAVGHYRPSVPLLDDLEMALRLALHGSVAELSAPLAIVREHTTNISQVMWQDALRSLREHETAFESFFGHEGRTMPDAARLQRLVRRRLAATAYWSAVSHLARGKRATSYELLRYCRRLDPAAVLLPPIGHLFRTQGAFRRARAVISEAFGY